MKNFYATYKTWRNKVRNYSAESIIHIALNFLQQKVSSSIDDIKRAPWQVLLIVKWVCQDEQALGRKQITPHEFDVIRQLLWEFPDSLSNDISASLPHDLFLRQLLHAQIGFQRNVSAGFLREGAILAKQDRTHPLRILFEEKTQLDINEFLDFLFLTYCAISQGYKKINLHWYEKLKILHGEKKLLAYIRLIARTPQELIVFFRNLPEGGSKFRSELFEFPVISRYPFLNIKNELNCWHEAIFFRGAEGLVHSVLSEAGKSYIDSFSLIFEKHVLNEAKKIKADFYDENQLKQFLPLNVKVPDALLSFNNSNVFLEAKAGLFDQSVMTVGNSERFLHMTKSLQKAINQGWSAVAGLQQKAIAPTQVLSAATNYLIVVTNKELGASSGKRLSEMYPDGAIQYPSEKMQNQLPLNHVYFLSIEDFERLAVGISNKQIHLPEFLNECVTLDNDPRTSYYYFEQHLNRAGFNKECSDLITQKLEEIADKVMKLIEEPIDS